MGKQGPCNHCGITSTPLWRNGPPEKPILCNACGSRWRTKGTLTNYTPLHARENVDQIRPPKVKTVDQGLQKRKNTEFLSLQGQRESETVEEDTSNRSSSGSAISYSESCSHFGSEAAGAVQSTIWDAPSRKRTCVGRPKPSSVEKLTMDLHSILHQQPSYISTSPEDDLLYDAETQFGSVEISNGGVLLRHPNVQTLDEESEASSLPVDTKLSVASESYSRVSSLPVNSVDKIKRSFPAEEHASRDKASLERLYLLRSKDSPLVNVDLKEVVNPEVFVKHLTLEEQQQLMKYLPSIDAARTSETLADMFHSPQFAENLSYFRRLLLEGTFDMSSSGATADECRTLKKLVLGSSAKSKWVEYHTRIKNSRSDEDNGRKGVRTGTDHPGKKTSIKSPKRSNKPKVASLISLKSPRPDSSLSLSPRGGTFGSYDEEEEGLLLDLRPNGSFPEAELLSETWKQTSTSSSTSHPLKHWGS